jgi:hypothetical protein
MTVQTLRENLLGPRSVHLGEMHLPREQAHPYSGVSGKSLRRVLTRRDGARERVSLRSLGRTTHQPDRSRRRTKRARLVAAEPRVRWQTSTIASRTNLSEETTRRSVRRDTTISATLGPQRVEFRAGETSRPSLSLDLFHNLPIL